MLLRLRRHRAIRRQSATPGGASLVTRVAAIHCRRMTRLLWWPAAIALVIAGPALAAQELPVMSPDGRRQLTAVRLSGEVVIDGALDEEVWSRAVPATDFIQADPHEGQPATELTEVRIAYDADYLYIGGALPRQRPGRHRRQRDPQGLRRPRSGHLRSAARHVRRSAQRLRLRRPTPRAPRPTRRWRTKGATSTRTGTRCGGSSARRDADGWTAEFRIPFKTLRFEAGDAHDLGHQLRAAHPAQERGRATGRRCRAPTPSIARRPAGDLTGLPALRPGPQPAHQAVRSSAARCAASASDGFDRDVSGRRRRQGRRHAVADARRHGQSRLRAGRSRRTAGQPHAVQPVLSREARVLPRELRHLLLRRHPAQSARRRRRFRPPEEDLLLFFSRRIGLTDAGAAGCRCTAACG